MTPATFAVVCLAVASCRSVGAPEPIAGSVPTGGVTTGVAPAAESARVEAAASASAMAAASASPSTSAGSALPTTASFAAAAAVDVRWMDAARRERGFKRVGLEGLGPVHLVWTRGEPHPDPQSGRPVARITLELTRDGRATRVDAGNVAGEIDGEGATLCGRLGYRMSNGALLTPPPVDGLVSTLSVGDVSGSDELMVVLGPGVLYVLRGMTTDGMCESMTTQGPLTVCRGAEYTRVAEVTLAPAASFDETIRAAIAGEAGASVAPLDCAAPTMMGTLVPPGSPGP